MSEEFGTTTIVPFTSDARVANITVNDNITAYPSIRNGWAIGS